MKTATKIQRFFLCCFLIGSLVDCSSLPSMTNPLAVTSRVGQQAVLPCSWKPRLGEVAPPICHVQWATHTDTVFEQKGAQKWEAAEFKGRAAVSEERMVVGDCSLMINDIQMTDSGTYDSFMVVNGLKSRKTRVFIQSIQLSILEHKSWQSRALGEDLVLDLYTGHAFRVIFQGRNSSEWSNLWMRGDENHQRLEKDPDREQITLKRITSSDEGTFKVLDQHGLTVSTVQLSVEEHAAAQKAHQLLPNPTPAGDASKNRFSSLLIVALLSTSPQILDLL